MKDGVAFFSAVAAGRDLLALEDTFVEINRDDLEVSFFADIEDESEGWTRSRQNNDFHSLDQLRRTILAFQ